MGNTSRYFKMVYWLPVVAIALPWFFNSGFLFFVDFVWGPNLKLDWTSNLFLWNALATGLGYILPLAVVQKLLLSLVLGITLWGGKKIAGQFLDNQWQTFAVSLFALFNPFVYDRLLYGQFGIVLAYGFLLWGVGLLWQYERERNFGQLIKVGIILALAIQFSPHFAFFIALVYVLFLGLCWRGKSETGFRKIVLGIVITAIIGIGLNANWLYSTFSGASAIGSYVSQGIGQQDLQAFRTAGKSGSEALRNVVMMSGFWGKDQFRYIDLAKIPNSWGRSFLVLLPLLAWGAYVGVRNKDTRTLSLSLLAVYIIAVVLAVGIRVPGASELTQWLFDHVPFYKGLRETQKWVALVVLVYLVFLSLGVRELFRRRFIQFNRTVMTGILAGVIVMQAPLLLWGFRGQAKPVQYPSDWQEINEFIVSDTGCRNNLLFLPWHLYMRFQFIGSVVANPAGQFFDCQVFQGTNMEFGGIYSNSTDPESKLIEPWLASRGNTDLLENNALNLSYIILAKEVDWQSYAWLDTHPQLTLIKDSRTLRVYKVNR